MLPARDTIFARSSGTGRAGVAVFRVSGPRAGDVLERFCGGRGEPRRARLATVRLEDGTVLDRGITLWFPGPASFTGEDVAELHLHGSPAVERAFVDTMIDFGLTPATAGAFTMRAFEAGKLDLAQAEGLGDLLTAETDAQRRQALGQLGGALSAKAEGWRARVLAALAAYEAAVDFPDEEDVPGDIASLAAGPLTALRDEMTTALAGAGGAARVREGVTVVITGPPNAGKSSLLNRLAGTDRAIVSDEAGTTRDLLEVRLEIGGQLVTLVDTAGLREGQGAVEIEGIERARRAAKAADLCIEVRDAAAVTEPAADAARTLFAANKTDLTSSAVPTGWVAICALSNEGTAPLVAAIEGRLRTEGDQGVLTRERHASLVRSALAQLDKILKVQAAPELGSEALRLVLHDLEELTGRIAPDDVLGEVFSAFCIGK